MQRFKDILIGKSQGSKSSDPLAEVSTVMLSQAEEKPSSILNFGADTESTELTNSRAFEIKWDRLNYVYSDGLSSIKSMIARQKSENLVLKNLSGSIRSNQLVAIIGPSGCGKTTLLNLLAGNIDAKSSKIGSIDLIGGLKEIKVAIIGQHDCLLAGLTVLETLHYTSRLQNNQIDFDHESQIKTILVKLGLTECAHRDVAKLSGGQFKRVTIAQELLSHKDLLILDEVTSGLDASSAHSIIKVLKHLVSSPTSPMSIVMSIHQPSTRLFSLFDSVYVMHKGQSIYEGGCDVAVINAFLNQFQLECPNYSNIADYMIEIASDNSTPEFQIARDKMIEFQRCLYSTPRNSNSNIQIIQFETSKKAFEYEKLLHHVESNISISPEQQRRDLFATIKTAREHRERPFWPHFRLHFGRSFLRIRRSYILTYLQLVTQIILGIQLGTLFGPDVGKEGACPSTPVSLFSFLLASLNVEFRGPEKLTSNVQKVQENLNCLLITVLLITFATLEITILTFPMEAKTVKREWQNGWYRSSSYFLGRSLAELPFQVVYVTIFCLIIYSLTEQIGISSWRFGSFMTIIMLLVLFAQSVGLIFGAIFMNNLPAAVFISPIFIFPHLLYSGYLSRISQIPYYFKPLTYLSQFRYAFEAILITLYGYDRCGCDQEKLDIFFATNGNQTRVLERVFAKIFTGKACNSDSEEGHEAHLLARINGEHANNPGTDAVERSMEDALLEIVLSNMYQPSTNGGNMISQSDQKGAFELMSSRLATRMTLLVNAQSNYGMPVPASCKEFTPYLMKEFELHDQDLLGNIFALFLIALASRLIGNIILNMAITSRV